MVKTDKQSASWVTYTWIVVAACAALLALVLAAKGLRELPAVRSFLRDYPGSSQPPDTAPIGFPAWLAWQHFLNFFFIILIIRAGWLFRTSKRPPAYWTRNNTGLIRTPKPPTKISLDLWFHFAVDWLWVINGALFFVLLFATGQWMRIVPQRWDVFPNAASAALQYASLNWPSENGWVNYNSLQLLTYFVTVFLAAPLAIASGLRMSALCPKDNATLNRVFPLERARTLHFSVMLYYVSFVVVHVTLVLATGALHNLNHMYGGSDAGNWWGAVFFALSLLVMIAAWLLARPLFLRPLAALTGAVTRR